MLRVLIGSGVLLMAVGFGAAGWQYWKTRPAAVAEAPVSASAPAAPARRSWLISPAGGLVAQDDVQAYLTQDRFVPTRTLRVVRQARLADLLVGDEKLPEAAFLQVLADIRAPRVSDGLCQILLDAIAQDCAVNAARVVEGSVDPVAGIAMFRLELVFRLKEDGAKLPDLATRVLHRETVRADQESGSAGGETPEAALKALLETVATACGGEGVGEVCRPLRLDLDLTPGGPTSAVAEIAWLDPLPKGMFVAPPLDAGG
ncbi:hypothetical protein [Tabrizicola sp.]|uniref:hypothetical protein n=1 Tax=Tabrizicola sp. TaxID=2005166 RepID=UPI002FDCA4FC